MKGCLYDLTVADRLKNKNVEPRKLFDRNGQCNTTDTSVSIPLHSILLTHYRIPFYSHEMGPNRVILYYSHITVFHFILMKWDQIASSHTTHITVFHFILMKWDQIESSYTTHITVFHFILMKWDQIVLSILITH